MKLSFRLQRLLDLIDSPSVIADIGTDHALLAIGAVLQEKAARAYACDVNPDPLMVAKTNITKHGVETQVIPVLSNGLDFLSHPSFSEVEIDCCVIAGMGSSTMLEILDRDVNRVHGYVLCANTPVYGVRQWAQTNQYTISYEDFFYDHNQRYWLMVIKKQADFEALDDLSITFGSFTFFSTNQDYQRYLKKQLAHIHELIKTLPDALNDPRKILFNQAQQLEEYLAQWKLQS